MRSCAAPTRWSWSTWPRGAAPPDGARRRIVATARESFERLDRLVANLLDISRLQAGVLGVYSERVAMEEIIPRVLDDRATGPLHPRQPA